MRQKTVWNYYENGKKATGWKAISEEWYYFNENGIMQTGWVSVDNTWYYLNEMEQWEQWAHRLGYL